MDDVDMGGIEDDIFPYWNAHNVLFAEEHFDNVRILHSLLLEDKWIGVDLVGVGLKERGCFHWRSYH